uniref:Uncharacterized protein n=1 Tax=Calcidiscus leptoporus TaxID=127549 RepID=A0A6U5MUD6_9EUKA|mmetsp:Transcript_55696/g.127937  ORF Transcript_55696/g.127937 Transcript_55696/m.127937 type:complete len:209 (+) Transcript_55696:8-634(+)
MHLTAVAVVHACVAALQPGSAMQALTPRGLTAPRRCVASMQMGDDALMASLRARLSSERQDAAELPVLGIEDLGADSMGPRDVVQHMMRAFVLDASKGCEVCMGFSPKGGAQEDSLGQVQPGAFADPASLHSFFGGHDRYRTMLSISEWKCMGGPDMSDLSRRAAQKLLIRREGANWEDFFCNLQLIDTEVVGKRWLITSVYKQGTAN